MKLEIDIISREMVTPSSQTPLDHKTYKLSFLDQTCHSLLMPLIFFYPFKENKITDSERSNRLKKSLSQALTLFYPLAGRVVDNSYVDCNDNGVTYVESRANCDIWDVIKDPNFEELNKLIPCNPDDETDQCLFVQVTFFGCGGLAIGLGMSHKVADGVSDCRFFNTWAAISRGDDDHIRFPIFESAKIFPPKDFVRKRLHKKGNKEKIVTKRFVFTKESISKIRDKYLKNTTDDVSSTRLTRIETLAVFVWTRIMGSTRAANDTSKMHSCGHQTPDLSIIRPTNDTSKVHFCGRQTPDLSFIGPPNDTTKVNSCDHRTPDLSIIEPLSHQDLAFRNSETLKKVHALRITVNIRTRLVPPLSENHFGNFIMRPFVVSSLENDNYSKYSVAKRLSDEIRKVNQDYAPNLPVPEDEMVIYKFSSICRFPFEPDFGWGKPVWFTLGKIPTTNLIYFLDSVTGDGGVDALVNLNKEDMVKFEADEELNQYVACGYEAKHWEKIMDGYKNYNRSVAPLLRSSKL